MHPLADVSYNSQCFLNKLTDVYTLLKFFQKIVTQCQNIWWCINHHNDDLHNCILLSFLSFHMLSCYRTFPSIPTECISGYQYSINGTIIGNVTMTILTLGCSVTDVQSCSANILTVRPIVRVENTVLNNVAVTASTCNRGMAISD